MSEEEVDGLKKEENEENKQRRLEELQVQYTVHQLTT